MVDYSPSVFDVDQVDGDDDVVEKDEAVWVNVVDFDVGVENEMDRLWSAADQGDEVEI